MMARPGPGRTRPLQEQGNSSRETIDSIFSRLTFDSACLLERLIAGREQIRAISGQHAPNNRPNPPVIYIPLGKHQPGYGPRIVYRCRTAHQAPCKLTHLNRSEAGKCHSTYNLRVAANKRKNSINYSQPKGIKPEQQHQQQRAPIKSKPKQDATSPQQVKYIPLLADSSVTKTLASSFKVASCSCGHCLQVPNWHENLSRFDLASNIVYAQYQNSSQRILCVYEFKKQGASLMKAKEEFCKNLKNLISSDQSSFNLIDPEVVIIGSTKCDLSLDDGDLNLCITTSSPLNHDKKSILESLSEALKKQKLGFEPGPRVKTINGRDVIMMEGIYSGCQIRVDIQIMVIANDMNLEEPIRLSNLFANLIKVDERFRILAIVVKLGAKEQDLKLKSINIVLMLIQYLQIGCRPPVLPMVPSKTVKDTLETLSSKQYCSSNKQSLSELLIGFYRFYSEQFDFKKQYVSITERGPRCRSLKTDNCCETLLYVEEPFTQKNTIIERQNLITPEKLQEFFKETYGLFTREK